MIWKYYYNYDVCFIYLNMNVVWSSLMNLQYLVVMLLFINPLKWKPLNVIFSFYLSRIKRQQQQQQNILHLFIMSFIPFKINNQFYNLLWRNMFKH